MRFKPVASLFLLASMALAVIAVTNGARAQDDSCKYAPRLKRLPACQATYCAAGKTDPAFQARLWKIDDTVDRFANATGQAESDFNVRRLVCRVLADPRAQPLNRSPTADLGELYMSISMLPGRGLSEEMADIVKDQDLFSPEAKALATTYGDQQCSKQLTESVGALMTRATAAKNLWEEFDCDTGRSAPATAPPHLQSCKDFVDNFKRLYDADDALKKLTECKTDCSERWQCSYARIAKIDFQDAAQELATYKARCAAQNPAFFAEAEKRTAEINGMSRDATKNCR